MMKIFLSDKFHLNVGNDLLSFPTAKNYAEKSNDDRGKGEHFKSIEAKNIFKNFS